MDAFGRQPIADCEFYTAYPGPSWGSNARSGLCIVGKGDAVRDASFASSPLKVSLNGKDKPASFIDEALGDDPGSFELSDTFASSYAQWFHHAEEGVIEVRNETDGKGTLLIVGDSYANDMERLFAESYAVVYHIDPRYDDVDIRDFIRSHQIDDALIMLNESFITSSSVLRHLK